MTDNPSRFLTLVGGNAFERSEHDFFMPEMFFNWLLKKCNRSCASGIVSDSDSSDLANAIEAISWTDEDEVMIALFGDDPSHNAIKELCDFLRLGRFTIRFS